MLSDRKGNMFWEVRGFFKVTVHREDLNLVQPMLLLLSTIDSQHLQLCPAGHLTEEQPWPQSFSCLPVCL